MDKKISQLTTATTPLTGTETLPIVQGGSTVKTTVQDVLGYVVNDSTNSVLKTVYSASDKGLKLDFVNEKYSIGDSNWPYGLRVDYINKIISLGDPEVGGNGTTFFIDTLNDTIKSQWIGSDIGLKLDFANDQYRIFSTNGTGFTINSGVIYMNIGSSDPLLAAGNTGNYNITLGDVTGAVNATVLSINDSVRKVSTNVGGNEIGLDVDFASQLTRLGDYNNVINLAALYVDYGLGTIYTADQNGIYGLNIDFNSQYFSLGDYVGVLNGTYIMINDNNQKLELSSNLSSGSAGGTSGQYLKITVGGVDYKIALLNNA